MAKYRVTDSKGESFVITGGDTPPTQELIQELINGINGYKEPEKKSPVLTPLSEDMKAKPRDTYYDSDYWKNFAIGAGQGAVSALGRIASGMTLGGTDWLDRKLGGNLKRLDEDLQRSAEQSGLGGLNKVAKFTTELGGNVLGLGGKLVGGLTKGSSALAKSNLGKKIGAKALSGLPLVATASGLEGAIQGATSSDKLRDLPQNVLTGGISGAVMPVAFKGLGYGIKSIAKPFTPSLMTEGMQGGLSNVVNNPDAVKLLNRGIRQSDDIANDFLLQSRPTARGINKETANMIDDALTSRINVPEAIKNANERYGKYMDVHGADEVFNFAPLTKRYKGGSDMAVIKSIRRNMSQNVPDFKFRTNPDGSYDYEHFISDPQRTQYLNTFKSTYKNPQIIVKAKNKEGLDREYLMSEYFNKEDNKAVYDKIVKDIEDARTLTKIAREGRKGRKEIEKELLKAEPSQASETGLGLGQTRDALSPELRADVRIAKNNVVVNNKLPHISSLYDDLTSFQSNRLDDAIKTGFSKTNAKQGSLESMNKVKQELNEQIKKAKKVEKPSEVWQLEELKKKLDKSMPEGLKRVDKGYEKAKRLEDAFERGKHYNPNNVDGSDYINELPPFEQNAFTQGLFKRINNNSLSNKNLANTALNYENTLASVLRGDKYDDLIKGLNRQSTRFERLAGLGRKAESKLNTPEAQRFFGREQLESKGSLLGSALDWANSVVRGKTLTKASKNLLNPYYTGELGAIAKGISSGNTLADYLIRNNPVLGSGLSATAINNMINQ